MLAMSVAPFTFAKGMKQAMILAAGLGTRLKPLTDTMPKALVKVGGQPLLWHVIQKLKSAGYGRIVVNVHHFAQQIEDYLQQNDNFGLNIAISDEREKLLDTGGGLKKAQTLFEPDEPILIHNVDILDNVSYEWFHRQHQPEEDAVLLVSRRKTKRYLLFDNAMRLMGWINRETGEVKSPFQWLRESDITVDEELHVHAPTNSQLYAFAFSGIHSFSPRLFPLMQRFPDKFSIIDFYLSTCHRAHVVGLVKNDLQVLDVGKLDSLEQAEEYLNSSNGEKIK